jgi:hypothetical protein
MQFVAMSFFTPRSGTILTFPAHRPAAGAISTSLLRSFR